MNKGFTLIEFLVAIAISSILIAVMIRFLGTAIPQYRTTFLQTNSQETARVQLVRIAHEIRAARYSDTGSYPIAEATPSRLIFYANIDADSAIERVRYERTGTTLVRGITKPSGNPLVYNTAQEVVSTIARSIQNGSNPVFMYYGSNYPSDTTQVPSGSLAAITYISFSLTIDADPASDPAAVSISSQVQLRNLKSNL